MVTITRHVFIYIVQTENISAVKFDTVYEKYMSFLLIQICKSPPPPIDSIYIICKATFYTDSTETIFGFKDMSR